MSAVNALGLHGKVDLYDILHRYIIMDVGSEIIASLYDCKKGKKDCGSTCVISASESFKTILSLHLWCRSER